MLFVHRATQSCLRYSHLSLNKHKRGYHSSHLNQWHLPAIQGLPLLSSLGPLLKTIKGLCTANFLLLGRYNKVLFNNSRLGVYFHFLIPGKKKHGSIWINRPSRLSSAKQPMCIQWGWWWNIVNWLLSARFGHGNVNKSISHKMSIMKCYIHMFISVLKSWQ